MFTQRVITREAGEAMSVRWGVPFIEISAMQDFDTEKVFKQLILQMELIRLTPVVFVFRVQIFRAFLDRELPLIAIESC